MRPHLLILLVLPVLGGCLPGIKSGDDVAGPSFTEAPSDAAPVTNRSYKAALFAAPTQTPSLPQGLQAIISGNKSAPASTISPTSEPRSSSPLSFSALSPSLEAAAIPDAPIIPPAQSLQSFYDALSALTAGRRREPVTILHLGDDHIADDRFTGDMRNHLQSRFGNAGRGLVMPGLFSMRGLKVERGGKWIVSNSAAGVPGSYGISGVRVSAANSDAWVRLTSQQGNVDWVEVTFATGPSQGTAVVIVDGDAKMVPTVTPAVDQTSIRISAKAREIVIKPRGDAEIALLSIATGTAMPGLRYVNLGLPGATAATPGKWNADFVAKDFEKLKPDLIVLGYGTREGLQDSLDIAQYEVRLQFLVEQFKQLAPQASLLIIGPPDAARLPRSAGNAGSLVCRALNLQEISNYERLSKQNDERLGRWHAPPKLDTVRAALRRVAATSGGYYWDWAKFMGGACSIHSWATANPPLAAPDHLTLTPAGSERSARALFADLMTGYEAYQRGSQPRVAQTAVATPTPAPVVAKAVRKKRIR